MTPSVPPRDSTKVSAGAVLLVICGASAAALVLAEVLLRILGISYPVFLRSDPVTGLGHIPNARGWFTQEGRAYVRINSEGWRDREHAVEKPAGVTRVAVLGDSHTEAFQVAEDETFWSVLERGLNARGHRRVEVLSFGVGGFGTASELLALRHYVFKYAPDVVLLAFTSGNDVSDNSKELKKNQYFPYFTYQNGALTLDSSFASSAEYAARSSGGARLLSMLANHVRLLQLLNQARSRMRSARLGRAQNRMAGVAAEIGFDGMVYHDLDDQPVWHEAWHVTEGLLLAMRDDCRAKGIPFFVVTLSNGIQVDPDRAKRRRYAEDLGVSDLFYPDRRIRELGERSGFEVLNLAEPLQKEADSAGTYFHGFGADLGRGHLNQNGHRRTGELITDWLVGRIESDSAGSHPRPSLAASASKPR